MKDMAAIERECLIEPGQEEILTGHQKPILLLKRRLDSHLAKEVAPGNPKVGVMLPYAPVQMLLFDYPDGLTFTDSLVMTSGNPSGAPICRNDKDAQEALSGICDMILSHNRKIRLRADDTVMDWLEGQPYMIRRSRGYAPLPFMLKNNWQGAVLGIGGELKNAFCLAKDELFYLSPHVGDLSDIRAADALRSSIDRLSELLEIKPRAIACDLHPRYQLTRIAEEFAEAWSVPLVKVQHHYAHILSCMAENGCFERVIGVAFDGTGFGSGGTGWFYSFPGNDYPRVVCIGE